MKYLDEFPFNTYNCITWNRNVNVIKRYINKGFLLTNVVLLLLRIRNLGDSFLPGFVSAPYFSTATSMRVLVSIQSISTSMVIQIKSQKKPKIQSNVDNRCLRTIKIGLKLWKKVKYWRGGR